MKRFLIVVALFVVALLARSHRLAAQVPGSDPCPTCVVYANLDWATHDTLAGWGFVCASGQLVNRVDVWYQDDAAAWVSLGSRGNLYSADTGYPVARPDVQAAFVSACPAVTAYEGFHFVLGTAVPPGPRWLYITVWRGYLTSGQYVHLDA